MLRLLLPLVLSTLALAQIGAPGIPATPPGLGLPRLQTRYPLPDWIRPGLVLIYREPSGQITKAYLVTNTTKTDAYGLELTLIQSPGAGAMLQVQALPLVQNGAGFFYLNPQAVAAYLKTAPEAARTGVRITGGAGYLAIVEGNAGGETSVALHYDPNTGVVQEITVMDQTPGGNLAADYRYAGSDHSPLPVLHDFPPAASEAHRYQIYGELPGYGMRAPAGGLEVHPLGQRGLLARFRVVMLAEGQPFPMQAFGVPGFGPHYLHPALLTRDVIYEIPSLGLSVVTAGSGPHGGVLVRTLLAGEPLSLDEYDPERGLFLYGERALPTYTKQVVELVQ